MATMTIFVTFSLVFLLTPAARGNDNPCGIYLAKSSLENGGLGVFAGQPYEKGAKIGPQGFGVQVLHPESMEKEWMLKDFLWHPGSIGGNAEADSVRTFLTGIGSLANRHALFRNVFQGGLSFNDTFNRYKDALAGATTPYHRHFFRARTKIEPGEEIFTGNREHEEENFFGKVGLSDTKDYVRVDEIIEGLTQFGNKHGSLSEEKWNDLLYRLRHEILSDDAGVTRLLPRSLDELDEIRQAGGISRVKPKPRDITWLEANGWCLDSIVEGHSKIPGAGRGAFASRFIQSGSIVAPAPLMQIRDGSLMNLAFSGNSTVQLLTNYCFGHRRSTIVLCPTSTVGLINHSKEPNVRLRWTRSPSQAMASGESYRYGSLDELFEQKNKNEANTRLMFEYVALRDIEADEEIYLDYGDEWENALREHHDRWWPSSIEGYSPANSIETQSEEFFTYQCALEPYAVERQVASEEAEDYGSHPFTDPSNWGKEWKLLRGDNEQLCWYPCILRNSNEDGTYAVEVGSKFSQESKKIRIIGNLPRRAIRKSERPYRSNQHLATAFRHYIPIPDSMFPARWRHDYVSARSMRLGEVSAGDDVDLEERRTKYEEELRRASCGVYFAPSNIPNAGFGTYTGVALDGKGISVGTKLTVVPTDRMEGSYDIDNYVWNSGSYWSEYEAGPGVQPSVMAVNHGALANYHPGLVNLELRKPKFEPMLDRCKDPGAGAFSDYVEHSFESSQSLAAGEELFVSYGEDWFRHRDQFKSVPLSSNYKEVDGLMSSLVALVTLEGIQLEAEQTEDLLSFLGSSVVTKERSKSVLRSIKRVTDLDYVIQRNGTAQATVERRSKEWFEKHGQCIDHLYVGNSTIPQAGKGAFSRRFLPKGTVIMSAPLVATYGIKMFTFDVDHKQLEINPVSLFLNYQFSHPNSSVHFFPINHAIMINHGSERGSFKRPNARLEWSHFSKKASYFRQRPLGDLTNERYSTMLLDFVATKDIEVDEEVLIDYGSEWEEAWNNHVREYRSPCGTGSGFASSASVYAMNFDKFNERYHIWSDEHFTVCQSDNSIPWLELFDPDAHDYSGFPNMVPSPYFGVSLDHPGFQIDVGEHERQPCQIRGADVHGKEFDVVIIGSKTAAGGSKVHFVKRYPKLKADRVHFINKPFKSDMYWPGAFRHPIKIPDTIFPSHWKDLLDREC